MRISDWISDVCASDLYAFNKSHSFGYGYITFQTAYLKAHYPAEYLSALLTSVKTNLDKAAIYLAECRTMGIEVHVPDVNRSVRSEERRVGKEWVSTGRFRWAPYH